MQRFSYELIPGEELGPPFDAPRPHDQVAAVCRAVALDDGREHAVAFAMNTRGVVVGYSVVTSGSVDCCMLVPRDVLIWGLQVPTARYVGVAHNHPSGVVEPSREDSQVSKALAAAAHIVGLDLAWSIVFTHRSEEWREILPPKERPEMGGDDAEPKRVELPEPEPDEDEQEPGEDEEAPAEDGAPEDEPESTEEPEPAEPEPDEPGEPEEAPEPEDEPDAEPEPDGAPRMGNTGASEDDVKAAMRRLLGRH